jgi:hypothetical protein
VFAGLFVRVALAKGLPLHSPCGVFVCLRCQGENSCVVKICVSDCFFECRNPHSIKQGQGDFAC